MKALLSFLFLCIVLPVTAIAAWVTHVIICIQTASYVFLIAGAICAPVGIIHGVGHWFGAW